MLELFNKPFTDGGYRVWEISASNHDSNETPVRTMAAQKTRIVSKQSQHERNIMIKVFKTKTVKVFLLIFTRAYVKGQ